MQEQKELKEIKTDRNVEQSEKLRKKNHSKMMKGRNKK